MRILSTLGFSQTGTAEILSYADSSRYLVAVSENPDTSAELVKARDNKLMAFNSMFEAQSYLHRQGFNHAVLRMKSAYDEISGGQCSESRLTIPLAH